MSSKSKLYAMYYAERHGLEKRAQALGIKKVIRTIVRRGEEFETTKTGYYELSSGEVVRGLKRAIAYAEME